MLQGCSYETVQCKITYNNMWDSSPKKCDRYFEKFNISNIIMEDDVIKFIIETYTLESGVRKLKEIFNLLDYDGDGMLKAKFPWISDNSKF